MKLVVVLSFLLLPLAARGAEEVAPQEWPQYRSPARDGVFRDARPMRTWPTGGPAIVWRQPLGKTFVHAEFGNGPRGTPTIDGDTVFMLGGNGVFRAVRAGTGEPLWEVDLTAEFGATVPRFGYAGSPLVVGEIVGARSCGFELTWCQSYRTLARGSYPSRKRNGGLFGLPHARPEEGLEPKNRPRVARPAWRSGPSTRPSRTAAKVRSWRRNTLMVGEWRTLAGAVP